MLGETINSRTRLKRMPCGCTVFTDPEWGVTRSYQKCAHHKSEAGHSGLKHHEVMGAIKDGVVQHQIYVRELFESLRDMGVSIIEDGSARVLEIGCGVGVYVPVLIQAGYRYCGLEPDEEAMMFCSRNFPMGLFACERYEDWEEDKPYDLILCAHAFEHMEDSPGMMAKAFSQLKPGGRLLLIVPNDDDLCNPDHLWFFNETSLRSTLTRIGFTDIRMTTRRLIPREQFIYTCASKP